MSHENLAVAISAISLFIASLALGWNVYRDVVLKPRMRVSFSVRDIIIPGVQHSSKVVSVAAVNHGPGPITCNMIVVKTSSWWRQLLKKKKWGVILHDAGNPLSSKLPRRLEVGETINLFLPFEKRCFLKDDFTHIGICDSFGRYHWASKESVVEAKQSYRKTFGSESSDSKQVA